MVYDLGVVKRQRYVAPDFIGFGGTVSNTSTSGVNYTYHTFTSSGTFVAVYPITVNLLIVNSGDAVSPGGYITSSTTIQPGQLFIISRNDPTTATNSIIGPNFNLTSPTNSGTISDVGYTWLDGKTYSRGSNNAGTVAASGNNNSTGVTIIRYIKYVANTLPLFDPNFLYTSLLLSNQSNTLTFSNGTVSMLLVAGGGGGGNPSSPGSGGGGGAGGLYINSFVPFSNTTLYVTVGAGGGGSNGSNTTVTGKLTGSVSETITVNGGGRGGSGGSGGGGSGGSAGGSGGGGGSSYPSSSYGGGASTSPTSFGPNYYGNSGGPGGNYGSTGGGGAGSAGLGVSGGSIGGSSLFVTVASLESPWSSSYAKGGNGGAAGSAASPNTGNGGNGAAGNYDGGLAGGSGIAIFWHLASLPISTFGSSSSYSISIVNGYKIYTFINGSGFITFGTDHGNEYIKDDSVYNNNVTGFVQTSKMLTQGSFNPYSTNWSTYLNGTTDYLSIQHSDAFNISSDFTLEGWFYATSSTNSTIISKSITSVGTMNLSPFEITLSSQNTLTTAVSLIDPAPTYEVNYLVVAGGGGGAGAYGGGGGGAGGFRTGIFTVTQTSTSITYTVTVGAGGATGSTGQNSSIIGVSGAVSITSLGGGGASGTSFAGLNGGSGGGGSTGGLGTVGQGNNGGSGTNTAGGGGGAGGVGGPGASPQNASQVGGPGLSSSISGSNVAYAGGGGGGGSSSGYGYLGAGGGAGGGGSGGGLFGGGGSAGTAGLGGGGGGDSAGGHAGGSGVVFISYPTKYDPASYTGSPTIGTSGVNRIYKFLTGGTITLIIPLYPKYTILTSQVNNNTWNHISLSKSQNNYTSILNGTDLQILNLLPATVEYLVVAGGGAGGTGYGGGGGGGGYLTATGLGVTVSSVITVTVGAGGTGSASPTAGDNSQLSNGIFANVTAIGGGAGAAATVGLRSGGSGGGATLYNGSIPGTGTGGQGTNGGTSGRYSAVSYGSGGGGGGAGAGGYAGSGDGIGTVPSNTGNQGDGGAGLYSSITGSSVAYAGGGGGGTWVGSSAAHAGVGGVGGGGNGAYVDSGMTAGTVNTGGGGGGASAAGASGGSGVVIIRYADTYAAASVTTGGPTITVAGGYRVYKWTTSGSITWPSVQYFPVYNNTGTIYIGYNGTNYFQGYISNFRLLNGTSVTALPRLPFSKVENTTFLISANNRINDKSDYNFTITRNGTPRVQKFSPFVNSGVYNKLVSGGSIYFNGISDYISVPPYSFDFKGYNFNIEFWAYPEAISSTAYLICTGTPGSNGIYLAMYTSGVLNFVIGNNIVNFASTNSPELTVRFREWNHIAVVRNNTLISLYINGNFAGSTSTSASISTILEYLYNTLEAPTSWYTNNVSIGRLMDSDSGYYKGYLSNLRVLKGNISERLVTTYGTTGTSIEYLIVAGGGGGAVAIGGGAGGFRYGSFITTQSTATYIITVGSGGSSSSKGIDSSIVGGGQNIVSTGGGSFAVSNGSGGSGSGGSGAGNSPSTSPSQGNNGGASVGGSTHGAGGGGAGGVGSSPTGSTGGAGGPGATSSISGSSTYYAGGGGGGTNVGGGIVGGAGGIGGGANGQQGGNPGGFSGTTNTGGGGGGGGPNVYGPAVGGSGGSGIVIIRYLGQPRGLGGNITTNVYGLYTVHIFLSTDTYIDNKTTYILPSAPILANTLQSPGFTINYMVVAGGGGGGSGGYQTTGGGGGAGGLTLGGFTTTNSMGLLTITVGSGGAGAATGFPSSIFGINIPPRLIAIGGGYGGGTTGGAGGSGGGGFSNLNSWSNYGGISTQNTAGRNGSGTGYGNAGRGGGSIYDNNTLGGGGGGAGSIGYLGGGGGTGGLGGDGLYVNVANSSTYSGIYSVGGARGGSLIGGSNTGNGGGGAGGDYTSPGGGGSGKVIIWHTNTLATSPTTTGTPGVYTTNSYKVYVFNTSGTLDFKYSDTSLLLNFAEAKIFDATAQNDIYSIGNVSLSTSIVKYNNASIYFNGNGVNGLGIVSTGTTNLIAIGYSNFTVEMWMYPLSLYNAGTAPALLDSRTTTSGAGTAFLGYTGETLPAGSQIGWKDNTSFVTTGTVIINSWNHVAVTRVGSLLSMYINGVVTSSTTNTTNYSVPFKYIGISYNSLSFNGYIDDLRITQNARYTAAFTPSAFVPQLK